MNDKDLEFSNLLEKGVGIPQGLRRQNDHMLAAQELAKANLDVIDTNERLAKRVEELEKVKDRLHKHAYKLLKRLDTYEESGPYHRIRELELEHSEMQADRDYLQKHLKAIKAMCEALPNEADERKHAALVGRIYMEAVGAVPLPTEGQHDDLVNEVCDTP